MGALSRLTVKMWHQRRRLRGTLPSLSVVGYLTYFASPSVSLPGPLFHAPLNSGVSSLDISFSNVEGGENILDDLENVAFNSSGPILDVNPQFCDPVNNQFTLQEGSLCMTASDVSSYIGAFDITCENLNLSELAADDYSYVTNYPNPFNSQTIIYYSLKEESASKIAIYNLKGQLVKNLVSEFISIGEHSVSWDGRNNLGQNLKSEFYLIKSTIFKVLHSDLNDF